MAGTGRERQVPYCVGSATGEEGGTSENQGSSLRCKQEGTKATLCQHLQKGPLDNLAVKLRGERMCLTASG